MSVVLPPVHQKFNIFRYGASQLTALVEIVDTLSKEDRKLTTMAIGRQPHTPRLYVYSMWADYMSPSVR